MVRIVFDVPIYLDFDEFAIVFYFLFKRYLGIG